MRIGTNHGSLSDRIMSRYGDTPLGMVESALEFLRICEDNSFHNIVLSMKSSNPQVMVHAYRLLIVRMKSLGMNYPLHLGVTEAGEGEDGRIKSAAGIGTLLEDGIGDTIRVSLTEDPEFEIPVAKALVERYANRKPHQSIPAIDETNGLAYSPFEYQRRESVVAGNIGGSQVPVVIADFSSHENISQEELQPVGYQYSVQLDKWNLSDQACDYIYCGNTPVNFEIPGTLGVLYDYKTWLNNKNQKRVYPLLKAEEFIDTDIASGQLKFITLNTDFLYGNPDIIHRLKADPNAVILLESTNNHAMPDLRRAFMELVLSGVKNPVVISRQYQNITEQQLQLFAATDAGALLLDGFGDGIRIHAPGIASEKNINSLDFGILQATRTRISKTEYISCPSCGRTLFDLQETTAKIRARTDHLKGLKIGIMGCIVNGPGEMADADYGYVGVGVGKITLYKGKEVVKRNIASDIAVDELIQLIKQHGDWIEP
jgi:(E)-4-hydroxy-3-methylbut-2-enyl-diphosphate synthase